MIVAIGLLQIFSHPGGNHLRQHCNCRVTPIHQEVVAQMAEMVAVIADIAGVTRILNAVFEGILRRQRMQAVIEALGHLPMLVQHEARIDQLEFTRGRNFHQTTSRTILPIAV